ncbi:hypothetical protein [Paraliomyxa miuraensis]|uniref:hypothetical protein n=1 Tax=Paraliomyxa miuraensis TaxID=376150 RepID=UPI002250BC19|nr:hypothetical protein [Paraliomyxa miuraensis]MCX4246359.1 hypothetical protein [Paraliomyxa miuraensis]
MMAARSPRLVPALALAALALAGPGCMPVCDEQGLHIAVERLATRDPQQRQPGLDALGRACPNLPASLTYALRDPSGPVDPREAILPDRTEDLPWSELLARTCPRTDAERDRALAAEDRDLATRKSCSIDRYGLLAPEDTFVSEDVPVFMLYEWMTAGRVDRALARDVVWPLLSASASVEELETRCLVERVGCARAMQTWGLQPPRSSSDRILDTGTEIRITSDRLSVEHVPLLTLHAGRPTPDAFVDHVAPALRDTLVVHAERARRSARNEGVDPSARILLLADHATPVGTLFDTLLTAARAGLREAQLVVLFGRDEPRALPLTVPRARLSPELDPDHDLDSELDGTEQPLELTFIVRRDGVEARAHGMSPPNVFPNRPSCEPPPGGCHDLEAIASFAKQLKALFPHETVATFRTDDGVPLQALVSIIDAVRGGESCRLLPMMLGEEAPPECLFYQAVLDAELPPLAEDDAPP